jgi:hypothetical protein
LEGAEKVQRTEGPFTVTMWGRGLRSSMDLEEQARPMGEGKRSWWVQSSDAREKAQTWDSFAQGGTGRGGMGGVSERLETVTTQETEWEQ